MMSILLCILDMMPNLYTPNVKQALNMIVVFFIAHKVL